MAQALNRGNASGLGLPVLIVLAGALAGLAYYLSPSVGSAVDERASASQIAGGTLVIHQSSQVYDAMIRFLNDGGRHDRMTLDSHPDTGLFSAYLETGRVPEALPGFFEHPEEIAAKWVLGREFLPRGEVEPWFGLILPGIKKPLCQKLNAVLHKDDVNADPAVSVYTREQWISGRVVLDGADSRLARRDGCAAASDGAFVYYRAMIRR